MLTMSSRPILFYSTRCSHSKQIIDTLTALNKQSLFTLVAIEGKSRAELPPFLKSVPTLYHPDTKDVYVGQDIFGYISKPVAARREVPNNAPASGGVSATTAKGDLESSGLRAARPDPLRPVTGPGGRARCQLAFLYAQ